MGIADGRCRGAPPDLFGADTGREVMAGLAELKEEAVRLEVRYLELSDRRAKEGAAEVDRKCREVDQELWRVKREIRKLEVAR